MEILSAVRTPEGIHVDANLDGEIRKHLFDLEASVDDIKKELLSTEENIKREKVKKAEQINEDKHNKNADSTIAALLSNLN